MSDREKVKWWKVLALCWTPGFVMVILLFFGAPAGESREIFTVIFVAFAAPTAVYLLILSWRAAYLSGMGKR